MIEPTARGDYVAAKMREYYEAHRETWWQRHKPSILPGRSPDRDGTHADDFMLGLINEVNRIQKLAKGA